MLKPATYEGQGVSTRPCSERGGVLAGDEPDVVRGVPVEAGLQLEVVESFRARLNSGHGGFDPGLSQRYPVVDLLLEQLDFGHVLGTGNRGHHRGRHGARPGAIASAWAWILLVVRPQRRRRNVGPAG